VQVPGAHAGADLGPVECCAEAIYFPGLAPAVGEDRGRAFRYASQDAPQRVVERDDDLSAIRHATRKRGQDKEQNLHHIVRSARLVGPPIAPPPDDRPWSRPTRLATITRSSRTRRSAIGVDGSIVLPIFSATFALPSSIDRTRSTVTARYPPVSGGRRFSCASR
jgi:hypothetical protein